MKHFSLSLMSVLAVGSVLALVPGKLHAQAEAGAARTGAIQVGATVSFLEPEATGYLAPNNAPQKATMSFGGVIYGSFDFTPHFGLTAEANYPTTSTPQDFLEKTYLFGGRYIYPINRYQPYAKLLIGDGNTSYDRPVDWISFPGTPASYFVIEYGAGLDYLLTPHINLRPIDLQFQHWSGYPGGAINPFMISIGAAYRFR